MARVKKKERQQLLLQQVKEKPFLTDEELAQKLNVSVQTIRLDRLELGIPELRGRIRKMAESAQNKVKSIESGDVVGELIDLELPRHHRMAWTADHLTPLSQGGDIYGERRPAHRACNSSRGDGTHPTPADKFPTTRQW